MNSIDVIQNEEQSDDIQIEVLTDKSAIIESGAGAISPAKISGAGSALSLMLPFIFMAVTLLGGLRFGAADNSFIFLKPPLIALVFAALLTVQFARSRLIEINGWISEKRGLVENAANSSILVVFFTATVQVFNSLLPEQGLAFWVIGFCFLWTLWTDLFAAPDAARSLRSTGAAFALAFGVKYLLLANLTAPEAGSWWQRIFDNPGKEAFTWLLDLPRYSSATGYIQFFTVVLYLIGSYLTPVRWPESRD